MSTLIFSTIFATSAAYAACFLSPSVTPLLVNVDTTQRARRLVVVVAGVSAAVLTLGAFTLVSWALAFGVIVGACVGCFVWLAKPHHV